MTHPRLDDHFLPRRAVLTSAVVLAAGVATGCTADVPRAGAATGGGARSPSGGASTASSPGPADADGNGRTLLAFFSRAGENYYNGGRRFLDVGNTAVVAGMIADLADVDVHEIKAADPYSEVYEDTVRRNGREQRAEARPAMVDPAPAITGYDTVLLGSGVWNVQAPRIMRTFVDAIDFTGLTVIPFVTYAVSGMGGVAEEYASACRGARMREGLAVRGEEARGARRDVEAWLRRSSLVA